MFNIPTGMIDPNQYLTSYRPDSLKGLPPTRMPGPVVMPQRDPTINSDILQRIQEFLNSKNSVVTPPRPPVPSQTPPPVTMGPPPVIDAPTPQPPIVRPPVIPPGNPVNTQPVMGVTGSPAPGTGTVGGPDVVVPGNSVNTQPVQASDWFDYHDKKSKGINVLEPGKKGPTEGPAPERTIFDPVRPGTGGGPEFWDSVIEGSGPDFPDFPTKPPLPDETGGVGTKPPLPDETGGVRKSDPVQATDWFDYHDKKSKGIDVLAPAQPTRPEPPTTSEPDQKILGYGSDGKTRMPMPDGFTPPSSMAVSMGLETFYNPTTGEEWTASTGGYTPGPGWVKGSKATYKSDPAVDQPQPPVSTDPLSPLENLYGQIGVSDEAGARDVISKILSGQAGDLTQEQQGLTGSGIYRRIANRLGMRDADGNLITPLSSVKTESGSTATPTSTQALQRLLDMENAESGSGIQLLLNYLQGRMRPPPAMPQPQPGPFGLVPGRGRFGMPGMGGGMYGGMGGGMYGMPRPPMFGNPYMNRMPFMSYAGMPNFRNPNIFGGYGRGFGGFGGPGVMGSYMAPMSYYGRQRPRFGRMPMMQY